MALTTRADGQTIHANWVNDYKDLFTGVMTDQPISLKCNLTVQAIAAAPGAPTLVLATGTALGIGVYKYAVSLVGVDGGETVIGTVATITTTSGNQAVNLSSIPTGPAGATAKRSIYRTLVNGSTWFRLATINDNTTTTYADTTADASLTDTHYPYHPTFGGSFVVKDASGNPVFTIDSDGLFSVEGGINFGPRSGGALGTLAVTDSAHCIELWTPQAGATALGISLVTWNGSATKVPFSVGGRFDGAGAWVDNSGNINTIASAIVQGGTLDLSAGANSFINGAAGGINFQTSGVTFMVPQKSPNGGCYIYNASNTYGFQFKRTDGTTLAEVKANGNFTILGSTYFTGGGANFAGFDIGETFPADQQYPVGTVLCPDVDLLLTQCTHDACHRCVIVSEPAFCAGTPNEAANEVMIGLTGRVLADTAQTISGNGVWVCSDGNGGVRQIAQGETAFALGFTLTDSSNGQVGIFIRPVVVTG